MSDLRKTLQCKVLRSLKFARARGEVRKRAIMKENMARLREKAQEKRIARERRESGYRKVYDDAVYLRKKMIEDEKQKMER